MEIRNETFKNIQRLALLRQPPGREKKRRYQEGIIIIIYLIILLQVPCQSFSGQISPKKSVFLFTLSQVILRNPFTPGWFGNIIVLFFCK